MANIGKPSNETLEYFLETGLPVHFGPDIIKGLTALGKIHSFTNMLVDHRGSPLNEQLASPDVLTTYILALHTELSELLSELEWKPWRPRDKQIDLDKVASEFADILAFIGVLITLLSAQGISSGRLAQAYLKKEEINVQRFLDAAKSRS